MFQPEDWDDEEDGEWTAPTIPNPEYKGEWKPKVCGIVVCIIACNATCEHSFIIFLHHCAENQEPQLQGKVEGTIDWQPRIQGWPWAVCLPQLEVCRNRIVAGNFVCYILFAIFGSIPCYSNSD